MSEQTREAVARGARVLDEEVPGWAARIDLRTFDMDRGDQCVLGQVFGGFFRGITDLQLWDPEMFGFFCEDADLKFVRRLWKREITQRLAA